MHTSPTPLEPTDAPAVLPFPNSDFEHGETGWSIDPSRGTVGVVAGPETGGRQALRIRTDAAGKGAKVESPLVPCQGPGIVELHGSVCCIAGSNYLGLWVRQLDADGKVLPVESWGELYGKPGEWQPRKLLRVIALDEHTVALKISMIAYPPAGQTVDIMVADFAFVRPPMRIPPLPSQYKLRPDESARLTAADIVGPDGLVYPNWTRVGVQGDIPEVPVVLNLADAGARPETDISRLLETVCHDVGAKGGGAILIDAGVYYLDNPVTLQHNNVVIRGTGRDRTRLIFRYSLVHPDAKPPTGWPPASVFTFLGKLHETEYPLAADGQRGATTLRMESAADLNPGDRFVLRAPVTPRWQATVGDRSRGEWGTRTNQYEILAIAGDVLTLSDPLRIDFPVADGSCLRVITSINRCGLEDLAIEHACRMPFDTLTSAWAWDCWARGLDVTDAGCSGVHFRSAKRCTVRDCTFTGFDPAVHVAHRNWWGYAGFTQSADCLMEACVFQRFRHGPQVQYGAQGNVIRNCRFEGSDMQWHAGWTVENLFENCVVDARGAYGSYGYGAYATGSNDTTHGPNGPRNVVYGCDFRSTRDGVMLWGLNENWCFLHNRFVAEKGAGFVATCGAFDHVIRNNRFILKDDAAPMLRLLTADCVGIEATDNILYGGNGNLYDGIPDLAEDRGNRALPAPESLPDRPAADPPSIYAWQQEIRTI